MRNVLIPVDGSRRADIAVQCVIRQARLGQVGDVYLLNVQPPFSAYIARFVDKRTRDGFRREQAETALADARRLLDEAGLMYAVHIRVGDAVETTASVAETLGANEIVVGADSLGLLGAFELHSFVNRLIRRAPMPVSVVKDPGAEMDIKRPVRPSSLRQAP
jgi:nucleotide-binding universal stress UspA family protein